MQRCRKTGFLRVFLALRPAMGLSQISGVDGSPGVAADFAPPLRGGPMILSAIAERLKRRSKDDFKGRHFQAPLILQAVCWDLRYPLELPRHRGAVPGARPAGGPATLNRWVLAYAPLIERRLRAFRKPHCGSICIDETYINPSYG